jgi:hypothetical protein
MSTPYGQQFVIESGKIVISIKALEAKGCTATKGQELASKGLSITCPSYTAYSSCLTDFAPDGKKYCHVQKLTKPTGTESSLKAVPPTKVTSGLINVEADELIANNKLTHEGGEVTAQDTAGFGSGWSGSRQVLWTAGAAGDSLEITFDVALAGTYAVEIYLARAPDYGQLKIAVDGKTANITFDGYSPRVTSPAPTQVGKFSMQPGEHTLRIEVAGANRMSKGHYVGFDRVRFYWSGTP